jgi:hypothetical protein
MMWAFWAAGVALLLVELNAGMGYLQAGLQQNMGNLLGWAPAMGMITLKLAEQSLWHWGTLSIVLQALPLAALGLLLVIVGVVLNKPAALPVDSTPSRTNERAAVQGDGRFE